MTNAHSTTPYWTRGSWPTTGDADVRPCSIRVYRRAHGNDRYTVAVAHGICDSTTRLLLDDSAYPHAVIIAPMSESPPFGFPRHVVYMRFIVQMGHGCPVATIRISLSCPSIRYSHVQLLSLYLLFHNSLFYPPTSTTLI